VEEGSADKGDQSRPSMFGIQLGKPSAAITRYQDQSSKHLKAGKEVNVRVMSVLDDETARDASPFESSFSRSSFGTSSFEHLPKQP